MILPELASIRIAAYEESGKFIGHRVLPVVGLCPGFRHVHLRTELGQPLSLATLFLLVVVKDYVPDGLSDFAEALANPIKYQSELDKRAEQLAVLTDDMEPVDCEETKKDCPVKIVTDNPGNGSPVQKPSVSNVTMESVDSDNETTVVNPQTSTSIVETNSVNKVPEPPIVEEIVAEPLEKILENKLVKEKKLELDKKLEALRKKHEKEKMRLQSQKSGDFGSEKRSKFYMSHKLVKRLSSKNM